jgi:hypothetical protein
MGQIIRWTPTGSNFRDNLASLRAKNPQQAPKGKGQATWRTAPPFELEIGLEKAWKVGVNSIGLVSKKQRLQVTNELRSVMDGPGVGDPSPNGGICKLVVSLG